MKILAFESSCDETAVAVVEDGRKILSDAIASQADLHALYGGVVPEIASRKHIEAIAALTDQALKEAGVEKKDIDAVAATYAPGLIGAVLVGLNFAKSAAYALNVPLIPVHHIRGHIAANYLAFPELEPPFLALCMSGATRSSSTCATTRTLRFSARRVTMRRASALTRPRACWVFPTPAASRWTCSRSSHRAGNTSCRAPMWTGRSWT